MVAYAHEVILFKDVHATEFRMPLKGGHTVDNGRVVFIYANISNASGCISD